MLRLKVCKILTGVPVLPITVGNPAMIYHNGHITRTTEVVDLYRKSATEIRFETRHTMYILKVNAGTQPVNLEQALSVISGHLHLQGEGL